MNETKKTYYYIGVALVLVLLAFVFSPDRITPDAFLDQGEPFYPDFTDPNKATTLEVINYDASSGTAHPFKVTFKDGHWTIPSHNDYPADGQERLAQTAAGVIDIKKDEFRSDNVYEHEAFSVIDPLSETAGLTGRGQKITIKGENDKILADFIIGNEIEGRENFRYVRTPETNRVYAVRMNIDISTKFEDWINRDLMSLAKDQINQIILKDYSINERTHQMENRDNFILSKNNDTWLSDRMKKSQIVDTTGIDSLLTTISQLEIIGVRSKPQGFSASLADGKTKHKISNNDVFSLQSKGFYFTRDGQLLSNEGELVVHSDDGVIYTLHFGEVIYGSGTALTSGQTSGDTEQEDKSGSGRYLFITTQFDNRLFRDPEQPANLAFLEKDEASLTDSDKTNKFLYQEHENWRLKVEAGRQKSNELNGRFADWYYVISGESFDKIHQNRSELIVNK